MGRAPSSHADAAPSGEWIEVTARVSPRDEEFVAEALRSVAPDGVSIEPAIDRSDTEDFAYSLTGEPSVVRAAIALPFPVSARRALRRRISALPLSSPLPPLRYARVRQADWAEEWKRFFHTQHVGRRIVVRPSWEDYAAAAGEVVIQLDPGSAFGTGQHPTTRLCLAAIEAHLRPGDRVLDLGAGSGVLAIAAALLGAGSVRALDIDAETVPVALDNATANRVAIEAAAGTLDDWPRGWGTRRTAYDLVAANISARVLDPAIPAIATLLRNGGRCVLSGYLEAAAPRIEAGVRAAGLTVLAHGVEGEWCSVVAARLGSAPGRSIRS